MYTDFARHGYVFLLSPQSNSNSTSLCLAMLNLTYVSNHIIINRLSRKVSIFRGFIFLLDNTLFL